MHFMRLLLALTSPFLLAWCASLLWMILDGHKLRPKFLLIFGAHRCTKSKVHSCREVEQKNILKFLIHGFIFLDSHRFFIIKSQSIERRENELTNVYFWFMYLFLFFKFRRLCNAMQLYIILIHDYLCHNCKVHIFWEGHKILRNLHQLFVLPVK